MDLDCHFREESLEKVTVVSSERREELSNLKSSKLESTSSTSNLNTRFTSTEFSELVGRPGRAARGIPKRISRWGWEKF
jgi:hypothetical protein